MFIRGHRNDVYPVQVALAADICINDMAGATAGLEAVDVGRGAITNGYNYKHYIMSNTKKQILFIEI